MKRWYFILIAFFSLSGFMVLGTYKSSGGHPSSTGAPGEATCADAQAGCHANAKVTRDTLNTVNTLQFSSGDSTYQPGKTYTVIVSALKTGIERFGFEIVALTNSDNSNSGSWTITDGNRTHTLLGSGTFATRKYVTHSISGTTAVSAGLGQWSFNWTAPSVNAGDITFYYATNCTNNNSNATGDALFLSSFTIHPAGAAAIVDIAEKQDLHVSYESGLHQIQVNYRLKKQAKVSVQIMDLSGKKVQQFDPQNQLAGKVSQSYKLSENVKSGVYMVQLLVNKQVLTEKVLVE